MSVDTYSAPSESDVRSLLLIWQHPVSRRFSKVARLVAVDDHFRFEYIDGARDPEFEPLHSFPDLGRVYVTPHLPAFFKNRVMSRKRSSYGQYATWLGLNPAVDAPFEVLARTGGGRATDTFHVVEEPNLDVGHRTVIHFFASGLSHIEGALGRLLLVKPGDRLMVRREHDNPVNGRALLIDATADEAVGWVPDWLLDDVHRLVASGDFELRAEQVNFDAPWHLKLLCRLEGSCSS